MFFVTDAWAQASGAAPAPSSPLAQFFGGGMSFPVMMALMLGIMYFMVIRPQSNERKKLEKAIAELQKGDQVLTSSGIYGTVVRMEADRAVLQIADGVKVDFARSAITSIVTSGAKG